MMNVEQILDDNRVQLVAKKDIWWLRLIGWLMFWNDQFMETFWTTIVIGPIRIIAYPSRFTLFEAMLRTYTIAHELEHVKQADKSVCRSVFLGNAWFCLSYAFVYFPVLAAYFRYDYEVLAYVKGFRAQIEGEGWVIKKEYLDEWVEWVSVGLWKYYLFTMPPSVTRKRLHRELADLYVSSVD